MGNNIVNDIVGDAVCQPTAEEQERTARRAALTAMRVKSDTEVQPETEILIKKFELERSTVSKFITSQVAAQALYEIDKNISASPDMALAF